MKVTNFPKELSLKNIQVSLDAIKRILTSLPSRKNSSSSERFCPLFLFISKKIGIFAVERDSLEYVTDVGSRVCFISITRWSIPFFLDLKKLIAIRQVVIKAFRKLSDELRSKVEKVTLDFSESMHSIVTACFPKAMITLDRFHHQFYHEKVHLLLKDFRHSLQDF